jgi:hypothetical protein
MSDNVHSFPRGPLKCPGVSRMGDNDKAILVSFNRQLTDEELRFFHEVCQRSAPLMDSAVLDGLKS